ncbi:riboflavin synthase [Paenibacillus turpanensis]|uniref:riboflavin synthase n=1 Tax=Paenibacillus turpanensis TaxID=2689078 RepID=UPI00140BE902|nr:riboflavin synthase [Paenibacillus turpanensis]
MFTGIIEEIGRLKRISRKGQAMVITVEARKVLEDVHLGDSIAVNGVCLTVVEFDASSFSVDVMPETFRKTTLKDLQPGSPLNLERAMAANGRFGGHIVQGHVDSQGVIKERYEEDNAVVFRIEPVKQETLKYIVTTGSITLDGISLTVVLAGDRDFTVSIIPHTLKETVLQHKYAGDALNIECDFVGKYIERFLQFGQDRGDQGTHSRRSSGRMTMEFLAENGFTS